MPELKYVISADDSEISKVFDRVKKTSKETTTAIQKDFEKVAQKQIKLEVSKGDQATLAGGSVAGEHAKRGASANAAYAQSTQKVTAAVKEQGAATATTTALQKAQGATIDQLRIKIASYQAVVNSTTDTKRIALYNGKIAETQATINQLGNAGKAGFDKFGNAISKNARSLGGMMSGLQGVAAFIPGIGLAGLAAFAIEPIMKYIAQLDIFGAKVSQIARNLETYNEINRNSNKEAGEQISTLKVLYAAATDVSVSTKERTRAAKELQRVFPESFKNSKTQAILNGEEKKTTDELIVSILKLSRAKAAKDKMDDIEAKRLDISFQKDKIRNANANEKRTQAAELRKRQDALNKTRSESQRKAWGSEEMFDRELEFVVFAPSDQRAKEALKLQDEQDRILKSQSDFLTKYIGTEDLAKATIEPPSSKGTGSKSNPELAAQIALQKELDKLHQDAHQKELSDNDKSVEAVRVKYEAIREKIEAFYKKFKNLKVDTSGVDADEAAEINAIIRETNAAEDKANKESVEAEKKRFTDLLKEFETFQQRKFRILSDANTVADELIKNGYDDQAKVALDKASEEITALDEANLKKLDSYKELFENVEKMTKKQTLDGIARLRAEVIAYEGSAKAKAALLKLLDALETKTNDPRAANKERVKEMQEVIRSLREVSTEFSNINGSIANIASGLITAAKAFIEIKADLEILNDDSASGTQKAAAGIGIAGAALAVVNSIVGYFKGLKAAKEAARKALNEFQQSAIKGEQEYQALLRKRDQDTVARGKSTYQSIIAQLELLKSQSPKIQEAYEKVYAALQGQSSVEGVGYKHGTWLRKAKTWDIMAGLAGADYAKLEKLYSEGKLKDQAKSDFEALRTLRDELEGAGVSVEALRDQLKSLLTGTSSGSLADSLTQLFQNGKFAAQDFGDSFEDIMKNAIVNSFKYKFMEDTLQPFYDEFASLFISGTPSEADIDALKDKYQAIGGKLGDQFKELEKITGRSLTNPADTATPDTKNTLAGAFSTASQESISLLAGQMGGFRTAQLETLAVNKSQLSTNQACFQLSMQNLAIAVKIEQNTFRTANNTDGLKTVLDNIERKMSAGGILAANGKG